MHSTHDCSRFEKDGKENFDFRTTKKGSKNANPVNQNFMQLSKKIKKLKKALKKLSMQKRQYEDSNFDFE